MVRVAPIKLFYNPRTLWFDPGDLDTVSYTHLHRGRGLAEVHRVQVLLPGMSFRGAALWRRRHGQVRLLP